jgi:anaerobic selenocysteine-containing dehydrogenase
MVDRIQDIWGPRTPYRRDEQWPVRVDEHLVDGSDDGLTWTQSACVLCSNGCGLDIAVRDGRMVGVRGRPDDRVSHGRLGPKGLYGWQANLAPDRLTDPLVRDGGELRPASWDEAMARVVTRTEQILAEQGPLGLGFYTSGQLFLEDYYTLAVVARGGLGTPHLDGNTRLCTATSDAALKETFGCDGDPGSLTDFDCCDTLFAVGHNMAETHTVLWARVLDRLGGPDRPRLVVVDPRPTPVAREADVHLAILPGTNVALLNAIQHELIANGWVDEAFVEAHTIGFDALAKVVRGHPPERAAEICGVDAADIRAAARLIGTSERLVSTCLQGVYQSHQATAAACQVNNITLLRGMIGRPGCTVLQMNGQPTAQNTRETGADGDLTGMRNWQNPMHVAELARIWNVDPLQIPSWSPPTHAMQIFRYAEEGAIRFLWVTGTNPAVSMPELDRIRSILEDERLFLVVSDAFLSETAALADVVLPAAIWGEKLGTFTNHDRTVHLSEQAVAPPGRARSDMAIFLDYARRLGLTDLDGQPLPPWPTPEECFDAFKDATRGRPCDYSGLTYDLLRGSGGIQWPCNEEHPNGTERLYVDHQFPSATDVCEDYGHDLLTGADLERHEHAALRADGRAMLRAAEPTPPLEPISEDFPLVLTTGRTVYHFHTRTKTGRTPELEDAAPEPWAELHPSDAERLGIGEGDLIQVESPRGRVIARARISGIRSGVVFTPFHYGYWDEQDDTAGGPDADGRATDGDGAGPGRRPTAANELTLTAWDPVSKQPTFKVAAVRVAKLADSDGCPSAAPLRTASAPVGTGRGTVR